MSRMGLEEPQRAEMEKELRTPLVQAVETYLARGLSREQAEDQAIRAANQSSFLFKHFGIVRGQEWAYFEHITLFLCLGIMFCPVFQMVRAIGNIGCYLMLLLYIIVWMSVLFILFRRVEISGGLAVHGLLRKSQHIPLDKITRVRFSLVPLVRPRRIVIETAEKRAVLDRKFHGFPGAAVALNAFASEKIDRNAKRYLEKARRGIHVPQESPTAHRVFTLLWAFIILGFFIAIRPLWWGFGFGLSLPVVLLAASVLICVQYYTHKETVKKGLTQLLGLIFLVSLATLAYAAIGESSLARWLSVVALGMIMGAIVLLWWRWSRAFLVGVFALGAIPIFLSLYLFPSLYCKELAPLVLETGLSTSSNFQILSSKGPIVWLGYYRENTSGNVTQALIAGYLNGEIRSIKLEKPGHWVLMSPTPLQEPCVLRKIPHHPEPIREVHIYDQEISAAIKVVTLPPGNEPSWLHFSLFPIWSPDAKYLITHTRTYEREVVNVEDGSVTRFEDDFSPIQWLDNKTLIGQIIPKWKPQDPNHDTSEDKPECIELWAFDVEKGTKEPFLRRELSEKEKCEIIFHGLKYAFIAYYEIPPADTSHVPPPDSCYIMNIETGERISVPIPHESQGIYLFLFGGWNEKKETLAYVANPEEQGEGPRIVVVDLKAKNTKERKFSLNEGIANIRLSPNAKRIFFVRILKNDPMLKWFPRWDLWDLEKDEIVPVRSAGFINSFLLIYSYPIWSPDSTWFAYPFMTIEIFRPGYRIEVVKFP